MLRAAFLSPIFRATPPPISPRNWANLTHRAPRSLLHAAAPAHPPPPPAPRRAELTRRPALVLTHAEDARRAVRSHQNFFPPNFLKFPQNVPQISKSRFQFLIRAWVSWAQAADAAGGDAHNRGGDPGVRAGRADGAGQRQPRLDALRTPPQPSTSQTRAQTKQPR
eukprot:COSAG04_NODE_222_length_19676_cov_26.070991_5_plen_166_part_00